MGWNTGYTIMENMVVTVYDLGVLTVEVLDKLMRSFVNSDVDEGGSQGLRSHDGLSCDEIMIKITNPDGFEQLSSQTEDTDEYFDIFWGLREKVMERYKLW